MNLPQIPNIEKTRQYLQEFAGYNRNLRIAENEFHDEYNITADNYPVLSTRKKRGKLYLPDGAEVLGTVGKASDFYSVIYKNSQALLYSPSWVETNSDGTMDVGLASDKTERKLLIFGAYLLIFPDCKFVNLNNFEDRGFIKGGASVFESSKTTICNCDENGNALNIVYRLSEVPNSEFEPHHPIEAGDLVVTERGLFQCTDVWQVTAEGMQEKYYSWKHISDIYTSYILVSVVTEHDSKELVSIDYDFTSSGAVGDVKKGNCIPKKIENLTDEQGNIIGIKFVIPDIYIPFSELIAENGTYTGKYYYVDLTDTSSSVLKRYEKTDELQKFVLNWSFPNAYFLKFDHIIECQNRLWACRYGENRFGNFVNEIYATELGSFDWRDAFDGLASDSYVATIGSSGPFTGACVINQNPVFFKEDVIHKVYVSASGAHQIITLNCRGVDEGSAKSISSVNETIIYKTRNDVVVFNGTSVSSISSALGDVKYKNAVAGASNNKYVMYCEDYNQNKQILTYDISKGLWHKESVENSVSQMVNCDGKLIILEEGCLWYHDVGNELSDISLELEKSVDFMFETGDIGFSTPDRKYISRLDLRVSLDFGAKMRIWLQYDSDGMWVPTGTIYGTEPVTKPISLPLLPRRCDHFRIKITGNGNFNLYSLTKILEESD